MIDKCYKEGVVFSFPVDDHCKAFGQVLLVEEYRGIFWATSPELHALDAPIPDDIFRLGVASRGASNGLEGTAKICGRRGLPSPEFAQDVIGEYVATITPALLEFGLFTRLASSYSLCWDLQDIYGLGTQRLGETLALDPASWEQLRKSHPLGHSPIDPMSLSRNDQGALLSWTITYSKLAPEYLEGAEKGDTFPIRVDELEDHLESVDEDFDIEDYGWGGDEFVIYVNAFGSRRKRERVLRSWVRKDPLKPVLKVDDQE